LQRHLEEKNRLQAENKQQAEEIESLKTQLAQAQGENQKLQRGMFGKCDSNIRRYFL
jgi:cell division septum initiation protein DivIVA